MLQIKQEAEEHLRALLPKGSEDCAIRVAVMGGAHGTGLGLIVDEAGVDDLQINHAGIPLIIDKKLMQYCKSVTIGFQSPAQGSCGGSSGGGFLINSKNPLSF